MPNLYNRRDNKDVAWKEYESSLSEQNDDSRPIVDPKLEWETDKSELLHSKNGHTETEFLDGYGTTNFGMSSFEPKKSSSKSFIKEVLWGAGIATGLTTGGLLLWKFKDRINEEAEQLLNYALLLRESMRSTDYSEEDESREPMEEGYSSGKFAGRFKVNRKNKSSSSESFSSY